MRTWIPVSPGGIAKRSVRSTRMMDVIQHFLVIDSSYAQVDGGVRKAAVVIVLM